MGNTFKAAALVAAGRLRRRVSGPNDSVGPLPVEGQCITEIDADSNSTIQG